MTVPVPVVDAAPPVEPAPRWAGSGGWAVFIGRRLIRLVLSLLILVSATFLMIHMIPGDPVQAALGEQATAEVVELRRHELGLDRPLAEQYVAYVGGVVTGDFGRSIVTGAPVSDLLRTRVPNTLRLAVPAFLLVVLIAMPLGLFTAVRTRGGRGRATRSVFVTVTGLLNSVPDYVLGTLLILTFVVGLKAFPAAGNAEPAAYVLPVVALVAAPAASLSRIVRVEALKVLDTEYVRAARARRVPTFLRYWRHVLPNMMTAALTYGAMILSGLIAGTVLVENIFGWPGLGTVISQAVIQKDYPLIQGVLLVLGATVLALNTVVDVVLGVLDPRSRVRKL